MSGSIVDCPEPGANSREHSVSSSIPLLVSQKWKEMDETPDGPGTASKATMFERCHGVDSTKRFRITDGSLETGVGAANANGRIDGRKRIENCIVNLCESVVRVDLELNCAIDIKLEGAMDDLSRVATAN